MVVINICKDRFDLRKKFIKDLELFENAQKGCTTIVEEHIIEIGSSQNIYLILDKSIEYIKEKNIVPNGIHVFKIIPSIEQIRFFSHKVLRRKSILLNS